MCNMKEKLVCSFKFKFSSRSHEIMLVCVYPTGDILACFIIGYTDIKTPKAYPIVMDDQGHSNSLQELLYNLNNQYNYSQAETEENVNDILSEKFVRLKNFVISDKKIILWSKSHIVYASLSEIRHENSHDQRLILRKSDFEIKQALVQDTNFNKNNHKTMMQSSINNIRANEKVLESSQDYIDMIYCKSKVESDFKTLAGDILIKVKFKASRVYLL